MPASPPQPARVSSLPWADIPAGPMPQIGVAMALAIVMLVFGRLVEFLPGSLTMARPVMLILGMALLFSILTGRIARLASSPITTLLLGFTLWSAVGLPFSVWRGGAFSTWTRYWVSSLLAYIAMVTLIEGLEQCRKAMYAIAASMLALLTLGMFLAAARIDSGSRYSFESGGTLANSNMLAMLLLMGLPFCVLAVRCWKGAWRLLPLAGSLTMAVSVLRTGSRAGILTLGILGLILFIRLSAGGKLILLLGGVLAAALGITLSADSALERYKTLFRSKDATAASGAEASALESSRTRHEVLRRSLVQTARNPLLGVGTGMFMVADNDLSMKAASNRGAWQVSHNGYTQLSSETGIPGALMYIAAIWMCLRRTGAIRKATRHIPELPVVSDMAFALQLAIVAFAIQMCFTSAAYECYFPILAGLTVAFDLAVQSEMRKRETRAQAAGASPAAFPAGNFCLRAGM